MKRTRKQRGMTLVELGTSVAVVAISLLGTAAAVATSAHVEDSTAQTQTAKRGLASLMDDIRSTDFATLVDKYDDTAHDMHGYGADGTSGSARVSVTEVDNNSSSWTVYRVTIDATFPGSGDDAEARRIVTYISDRRRGSSLGGTPTVTGGTTDPTTDPTTATTTEPTTAPGNGNGNGRNK